MICLFCPLAIYPTEPECYLDKDCPYPMSCLDNHCQNVCQRRNPCEGNLQCSVVDTPSSKRIVACSCPAGYVTVMHDYCEQGIHLNDVFVISLTNAVYFSVEVEPQCTQHVECQDFQICHQGSCQNACRFHACGLNSICSAQNHVAKCECLPGYDGANPNVECSLRELLNSSCLKLNVCMVNFTFSNPHFACACGGMF